MVFKSYDVTVILGIALRWHHLYWLSDIFQLNQGNLWCEPNQVRRRSQLQISVSKVVWWSQIDRSRLSIPACFVLRVDTGTAEIFHRPDLVDLSGHQGICTNECNFIRFITFIKYKKYFGMLKHHQRLTSTHFIKYLIVIVFLYNNLMGDDR